MFSKMKGYAQYLYIYKVNNLNICYIIEESQVHNLNTFPSSMLTRFTTFRISTTSCAFSMM